MKMRTRSGAVAVMGAAAALLTASMARADIKIVSEITITGMPAAARQSAPGVSDKPMTTTVYYKGSKQRTETGNTVQIYDAAADQMYTLDTDKKTYSVISPSKMLEGVAGNPFLDMMKFDTTASVKAGGATKNIAGKPATNYVYSATIKITMDNLPPEAAGSLPTMEMKGEQWATESLSLPSAFQKAGLNNMARRMPPMMVKGMKPLIDELAKIKGAPLSSRMSMSFIVPPGSPAAGSVPKEPIVTTTEVKSISEETLSDSLFEIPTGYKKVEAPKTPGIPGA